VPTKRDNPYLNFNFLVQLGDEAAAGFSEVELPEGRIEAVEYREGDDPGPARKLPGRVSYGHVVLRRGLAGGTDLFDWWRAVRDGQPDRRDVSIVLLDEARNQVATWRVRNAWPTRLAYSRLDGRGNDVVIETLELAHEGFELE
jgi:phage tail-like protein